MRDMPYGLYEGSVPSAVAVYRTPGVGLGAFNAAEFGIAHMANIDRPTADTAGFIPQVWAQRALDVLRSVMVLSRFVTKDTDFEPAWKGKTLNIPYPGTFVAQNKSANTQATVQQPTGGQSVAVTLASHKYVDFIVEDAARAQASSELLDRYVRPAAIAIGNAVEDDLFALAPNLTTPSVGAHGTPITASTIRSARSGLNGALAPMDQRAFIMSPNDEISVLGDTTLQSFFAFAKASGVTNGQLPPLYGFDASMSQRVPVPTATVTLNNTPTGGTFTITYGGQTTSALAFNASAATVQTAIQALSSVGAGNATVTLVGTVYTITFAGTLAENISAVSSSGLLLTGAGAQPTAVTQNQYSNLAIHRDALILATRPFLDPPDQSGVRSATVADPETGIVMRVQWQYSMADRGVRVGFDILYGVQTLRPTLGLIVAS
ncbi:MAG: P22 phage major capsid protein family protein [Candidatus Limnocylindrales bacterium]